MRDSQASASVTECKWAIRIPTTSIASQTQITNPRPCSPALCGSFCKYILYGVSASSPHWHSKSGSIVSMSARGIYSCAPCAHVSGHEARRDSITRARGRLARSVRVIARDWAATAAPARRGRRRIADLPSVGQLRPPDAERRARGFTLSPLALRTLSPRRCGRVLDLRRSGTAASAKGVDCSQRRRPGSGSAPAPVGRLNTAAAAKR